MQNLLASLVLVALVGCGAEDSGAPNNPSAGSLQGSWLDSVEGNSLLLTFSGSTWKMQELFALNSGKIGLEIDSGSFTSSGNTFTLTWNASSCEGVLPPMSGKARAGTFSQQGTALTLTFGTSVLVFQKSSGIPTGMGTATIGCLKDDGTFITHAVTTIP